MKFHNYSLNLNARISEELEYIYPEDGWASNLLAATVTLECQRCGSESRPVRLCKCEKVKVRPRKQKARNLKPRDFINANAAIKCEGCGNRDGIVTVSALPGVNLVNGRVVTLMELEVSNVVPKRVVDFQFAWRAKPAAMPAALPFHLNDGGEASLNVSGQVAQIRVTSEFSQHT